MRTVWKFQVPIAGPRATIHSLSEGFRILCAHMWDEDPYIWVELDSEAPFHQYLFMCIGTGHRVPEGGTYCGTVFDYPFVWHVYRVRQ